MGRKRENGVSWSDLPNDPLEKISESLDTETDFLRFRAVCKSWRSSTTSFKKFPFADLKLPFPFSDDDPVEMQDASHLVLTERTVYRVQSPKPSNPNSWLLKTQIDRNGKLRLVNPLNDRLIKILPETPIPKVINTLNFRVFEVCRSYTLHYVKPSHTKLFYEECPYAKKVAVYANSESKDYIVMAIDHRNKLWYIKSGDEKWTMMDREFYWANSFHDVTYYKGQFLLVDEGGAAWVLDSNFVRTNVTCYSMRTASMRRLVELYDGELYLVEGVTDRDKRRRTSVFNMVVEVVISKMDRSKGQWVKTKMVKDRVIFMGEDCSFALPSKEFKGCDGGCLFYTDAYIFFRTEKVDDDDDYGYDDYYHECDGSSDEEDVIVRRDDFVPGARVKSKFRGWYGHNVGVYDFKSREIGSLLKFPEHDGVFWPPPQWLK